jgi:hypothetical protein
MSFIFGRRGLTAANNARSEQQGMILASGIRQYEVRIASLHVLHRCHEVAGYRFGSANATNESPDLVPSLPPPPAAMATYCRPLTEYVHGVA